MQEKTLFCESLNLKLSPGGGQGGAWPSWANCVGLQLYHNLAMPLTATDVGKVSYSFLLCIDILDLKMSTTAVGLLCSFFVKTKGF